VRTIRRRFKKSASTRRTWNLRCFSQAATHPQSAQLDIPRIAVQLAGTYGEKVVAQMGKIAIVVTCAIGHGFRRKVVTLLFESP